MTEGDILLRDILIEPDDTSLRLIYADWLEDHDEPERAMLVRGGVPLVAQRGLIEANWIRWLGIPSAVIHQWKSSSVALSIIDAARLEAGPLQTYWQDGFITGVNCDESVWLRYAGLLCRLHPIRSVLLADKRPSFTHNIWFKGDEFPSSIYLRLHDHLPPHPDGAYASFPDKDAAFDALSYACIAYGREMAGLPAQ